MSPFFSKTEKKGDIDGFLNLFVFFLKTQKFQKTQKISKKLKK
jgi:hypothetical protein